MTQADSFDLARYFARIHYDGGTAPTLATLNALTAAHAQAIPFENVDVLLRRPILLEPAAIYRKLVLDERGGYCFEQNGLLLRVLRALGFQARPLGGRVRLGVSDRALLTRRTHMIIRVEIDGSAWITDVGVGGSTLTAALRLEPDVVQATPHEPRRLQREGARWYHQIQHAGAWSDVYEFALEDFPPIDRELANWYTSTSPATNFWNHLGVALAQPEGRRIALADHEFREHAADGSTRTTVLATSAEIVHTLAQRFGIRLPAGARLPPLPLPAAQQTTRTALATP